MRRFITVLIVTALMAVMLVAGAGIVAGQGQGTDNAGIPGCEHQKNRSEVSGDANQTQQGTGVNFFVQEGDEGLQCSVQPNDFSDQTALPD
jgi:hypothetical protein